MKRDPIAVVGMGCQFPGECDSPGKFWAFLRRGGLAVGEIPPGRWSRAVYDPTPNTSGKSISHWGGLLPEPFPRAFDAAFFGISPQEALGLDPQQRLLLETVWRACEDAGLAPAPDQGRPVGVFVGIGTADYHGAQLWQPDMAGIDHFTATGASFAAAAGRLSYVFGFEGPCLAVDTACSSSLVAVHLACQALLSGECEAALAAGVNALLTPNLYVCLSRMGLMSADGRCKAFDSSADGYVRAEGCGVLVLKTMAQARRDGDRILAVLRGSAVNQDGRSNGLTAPSRRAQERVIRRALASAELAPGDIDYVEAHGTGTPLGDVIELGALADAYATGRDPADPLLVGSVKTNIGHLEAGAGMAGLIKAILSVRHREIPRHLHVERPTAGIDWAATAMRVPTALTPWPDRGRPRRAGVSAFGFSGTNAHVIVEQAPEVEREGTDAPALVALPLSARSPDALARMGTELADWLDAMPCNLADVGLTLGAGRAAFAHRRVVVGGTRAELAAMLRGEVPLDRPARDGSALAKKLEDLARVWVDGGAVDWASLYAPFNAMKTELPGHPFNPKDFWLDPVAGGAGPSPAADPPASPPAPVPVADRKSLRAFIDGEARRILGGGPSGSIDPERALLEQGFTSLTAVELCMALEKGLGLKVPTDFFFNYPSVDSMVAFFSGKGSTRATEASVAVDSTGLPGSEYAFLDSLSEEELEDLIDREVGSR